jgi:hypothetical protein
MSVSSTFKKIPSFQDPDIVVVVGRGDEAGTGEDSLL